MVGFRFSIFESALLQVLYGLVTQRYLDPSTFGIRHYGRLAALFSLAPTSQAGHCCASIA
jgi:hypothetical protein